MMSHIIREVSKVGFMIIRSSTTTQCVVSKSKYYNPVLVVIIFITLAPIGTGVELMAFCTGLFNWSRSNGSGQGMVTSIGEHH